MNESKALLGLPSEFKLAGVKVRVYQPGLLALDFIGPAVVGLMYEKDFKAAYKAAAPLLRTIKLPIPLPNIGKLWWYRHLNAAQQAHFIEKWLEAVDMKGIKDCFQRAGKALAAMNDQADTP